MVSSYRRRCGEGATAARAACSSTAHTLPSLPGTAALLGRSPPTEKGSLKAHGRPAARRRVLQLGWSSTAYLYYTNNDDCTCTTLTAMTVFFPVR